MPIKRFSLADAEAKGTLTKKARLEQARDASPTLIAVARPWGSAFLAFEGAAAPKADFDLYKVEEGSSLQLCRMKMLLFSN